MKCVHYIRLPDRRQAITSHDRISAPPPRLPLSEMGGDGSIIALLEGKLSPKLWDSPLPSFTRSVLFSALATVISGKNKKSDNQTQGLKCLTVLGPVLPSTFPKTPPVPMSAVHHTTAGTDHATAVHVLLEELRWTSRSLCTSSSETNHHGADLPLKMVLSPRQYAFHYSGSLPHRPSYLSKFTTHFQILIRQYKNSLWEKKYCQKKVFSMHLMLKDYW